MYSSLVYDSLMHITMDFFSMAFSREDVEILQRREVYRGFFRMEELKLRHRRFDGGWTETFTRELFIRGDAVGVLLHDPANRLVGLIQQFRVGALAEPSGPWLYELVAGMVDSGETPSQVAARELEEEAGITDCKLEPICNYLVSPGGCDEKLYLFYGATDLSGAGGRYGIAGEHEDIYLHVFSEDEVFAAFAEGRFNNAATTIALLWLQKRIQERL